MLNPHPLGLVQRTNLHLCPTYRYPTFPRGGSGGLHWLVHKGGAQQGQLPSCLGQSFHNFLLESNLPLLCKVILFRRFYNLEYPNGWGSQFCKFQKFVFLKSSSVTVYVSFFLQVCIFFFKEKFWYFVSVEICKAYYFLNSENKMLKTSNCAVTLDLGFSSVSVCLWPL